MGGPQARLSQACAAPGGGMPGGVPALQTLSAAQLEDMAHAAGFELAGVARAEPVPPEVLTAWLEAGFAADMDWMGARAAERLDVRQVLPGVLALATNYFRDDPACHDSPVARYARGRDYHATLKDRLRALRRSLVAAHPWVQTYACVDTGPLMEKVWAARAGLGYVGRNGCFITEPFGSWVLLGTLVLDAPVDTYASGPAADRCGHCRRCLVACPTGALVGGGVVDARRCLSYQTIENRSQPVPEPLRAGFDGLAFGCDVCQDVCPLNRRPVVSQAERFAPRAVASLGVEELAALTPEDYGRLVPGTALARAKYDGLRRNAVYALGACRRASARALLERLQDDPSELVRSAAAWALGQLTA
jgi:epoxyqueuosine reductase